MPWRGKARLGPARQGRNAQERVKANVNTVYRIKLTGITDLLMHWDNIDWADEMAAWSKRDLTPGEEKSKAGDDRSPAWRWIGSLYHDGEHVAIPSDNLMRCFMEGGAFVPVPGAKSANKTFKAQTQSGALTPEPYWKLRVHGDLIPYAPFAALVTEADFAAHRKTAEQHGFSLNVKRARIGASKHIRVRPRFSGWSAEGALEVQDPQLTLAVLNSIWSHAGRYKGLCDWRPGSKTPGPWGTFGAEVTRV